METGIYNDTCHVVLTNPSGKRQDIVLQKMNTKIFKNPKQLMDNVIRVTDHLRHKIVQRGGESGEGNAGDDSLP